MGTRGLYGWGPTWTDLKSYLPGTGSWSLGTYAGRNRLKTQGAIATQTRWGQPATTPLETYRWGTIIVRYVSASIQDVIFAADSQFSSFLFAREGASTFCLHMGEDNVGGFDSKAEASVTLNEDTDILLFYQVHSPSKAIKLWIDGVLLIEYTPALQGGGSITPRNGGVFQTSDLTDAADALYFMDSGGRESDVESGRPDSSPTYSIHDPSANTSEDDATKHGTAPSPDEKWNYWSDHSNPNEDTTYLLLDEAAERKQVSEFSTGAALTGNMDAASVSGFRRARAAAAGKDADSWMRFKDDGGSVKEFAHANLGGTYITKGAHCGDPPAGTWSDYINGSDIFNGSGSSKKLEMGVRTPEPNDTNIRITSKGVEVCVLGDDPPPVAAGQPIMLRRRGSTEPVGAQRIGKGW